MMLTHERTVGDVTILDLEGEVLIGCDDSLYEWTRDLIERGRHKVILNLAALTYWEPSCALVLVRCLAILYRARANVGLLSPQAQVRGLLKTPALAEGLRMADYRTFDDEAAALRSLQAPDRE